VTEEKPPDEVLTLRDALMAMAESAAEIEGRPQAMMLLVMNRDTGGKTEMYYAAPDAHQPLVRQSMLVAACQVEGVPLDEAAIIRMLPPEPETN
jgi:hypothetical protein